MFKTGDCADMCRRACATGWLKTHGVPVGSKSPGYLRVSGDHSLEGSMHQRWVLNPCIIILLFQTSRGEHFPTKKNTSNEFIANSIWVFSFLLAAYVYISMLQDPSRILLQVCRGYLAKASTESWMALGDGLVTQCSVSLQNSFWGVGKTSQICDI